MATSRKTTSTKTSTSSSSRPKASPRKTSSTRTSTSSQTRSHAVSQTKPKAKSSTTKASTSPARRRTTTTAKTTKTTTASRPNSRPKKVVSKTPRTSPKSSSTSSKSKLQSSQWQGITALVLAISAIVFCLVPVLNFILALLALIFGILALKTSRRGFGIASIIMSTFTLVFVIIFTITFFAIFSFVKNEAPVVVDEIKNLTQEQKTEPLNQTEFSTELTDSQLSQFLQNFLFTAYDVSLETIEITEHTNHDTDEIIMATTPSGDFFAFYSSPAEIYVANTQLYTDDIDSDFHPDQDHHVSLPEASLIQKTNHLITTLAPNISPITFTPVTTASFTTDDEQYETALATYVTREDGYGEIAIKADNSDSDYLFLIFSPDEEVMMAGVFGD